MNLEIIRANGRKIRTYLLAGWIFGLIYGLTEYIVRLKTGDDPQSFAPLLIRASITGAFIMGSISLFEALVKNWFKRRQFVYLVLVRSLCYTIIISFWLTLINAIWFFIKGATQFWEELANYFTDDMYFVNLTSVFLTAVLATGLSEINSLHGKGQLWNFVLGRYHTPREVELIFCFIDLKGSTTIAEKLGHLQFAMFLRDFFSDITEAIQSTDARIYQYIGDEIVLSWTYEKGVKNNNMINCFFYIQEIIEGLQSAYVNKYGSIPEIRAGLHGGQVTVTWVGELRKEIVYIGDVLNTTARIQEACKRLGKNFLISEELLLKMEDSAGFKAEFEEESILRGKKDLVRLYSLERY